MSAKLMNLILLEPWGMQGREKGTYEEIGQCEKGFS